MLAILDVCFYFKIQNTRHVVKTENCNQNSMVKLCFITLLAKSIESNRFFTRSGNV